MGHKPNSTKDRLFFAALRVFAAKGFEGATVREICQLAESANVNAVTYHFGGKANLYEAILESMFTGLRKRVESEEKMSAELSPEDRLCEILRIYCAMLFGGGEVADDFRAIFNAEMARPSALLNTLIDRHMIRQNNEMLRLMDQIVGPGAPRWLLQDCVVSVFSQVLYYSGTWPIYSRVNPAHPGMAAYHGHLAEHACRFSLAGLKEIKRAFEAGELSAPDNYMG